MKTYSRQELEVFARQMKNELGEAAAVVLIGSTARNCAMQRSDIDILLVADQKPVTRIRPPRFELHRFGRTTFIESLRTADDFPQWCVRYGVALAGDRYWDRIVDRISNNTGWPDWRRKIVVAGRRWLTAKLFLAGGDADGAGESALFAYDHLIRGLLLREQTFPLSRPELVKQIIPLSPQLGKSLNILLKEPFETIDFAKILQPLTATLNSLNTDAHQEDLEQFEKISTSRPELRISNR